MSIYQQISIQEKADIHALNVVESKFKSNEMYCIISATGERVMTQKAAKVYNNARQEFMNKHSENESKQQIEKIRRVNHVSK